MKRKYQVFVSSTFTDLTEERAAVTQCLLDNECIPVGMEQFPASNMSQMEYIKMMLRDCDYYLLILAGRYGSRDTDGVGFTEKEYDYAKELGLPIITFLIHDIGKLPYCKCEDNDEGKILLEKFRKKVSFGKLVNFYDNIGDLKGHVATSINRCKIDFPAKGWIRLDDSEIAEHFDVRRFVDVVNSSSSKYKNQKMKASFTFDYSNNNGEFTIGEGELSFTTKWSKASDKRINAYDYPTNIKEIARLRGPVEWEDVTSGKIESIYSGELDFSSHRRTADIGDIIIWRNIYDKYAATKIIEIMDDRLSGSLHDELTCEFVIYQ